MLGNELLLSVMAAVNQMQTITAIRWDEKPVQHAQGDFVPVVVVEDTAGNTAIIPLHEPYTALHGLDHALIRVLVWLIQMQRSGDSTVPLGSIADMVNPCRFLLNAVNKT